MGSLAASMFHFICVHDYHRADEHIRYDEELKRGFDDARKFFDNFGGRVNVAQKAVLDIGCGLGSNCILMAQKGAARVVGIDIVGSLIDFANLKLMTEYKDLSNIVEFRLADDVLDEKFDVIISKDSFEHYANPEKFFTSMKDYLRPGGTIVIGFGPLWKTPYGGHITYMKKVPWAHLLFPESVIMQERRRFRDDGAGSFEKASGGLNKMTLKRYSSIIAESGLEIEYLKTNVSKSKLIVLFNILRRILFCREYFTQNVYSVMRKGGENGRNKSNYI